MQGLNPFSSLARRVARNSILPTALLLALPASAQTVAALPDAATAVALTGAAKPTDAWKEFCGRMPKECAVDTSEPEAIVLTPKIWQSIVKVNERVNATIKAVTDMDHIGILDRWDFPDDGKGDCEDIQLLKRRKLAEMGLPYRAMRMTVVVDELGEGHAVMMIRTDRGDYVLDNKHSMVLHWQKTGYTYIKREGSGSQEWVHLGGVIGRTTTASAGQ